MLGAMLRKMITGPSRGSGRRLGTGLCYIPPPHPRAHCAAGGPPSCRVLRCTILREVTILLAGKETLKGMLSVPAEGMYLEGELDDWR